MTAPGELYRDARVVRAMGQVKILSSQIENFRCGSRLLDLTIAFLTWFGQVAG